MNWVQQIIGHKVFRQVEVHELKDLPLIHQPNINLVYLKRSVDPDIEAYSTMLIRNDFTGINEKVTPETLPHLVNDRLNDFGLNTTGKYLLARDIIHIADAFFSVTGAKTLRVILKVVGDDACRKFHTDAYALRLLCTYLGKGTEWVEEKFVNRKKLVHGTNKDIIKDLSKVRCMEPFEVAILKGEPISQTGIKGIVHRSPPIQSTGEKRLLFRIDY